MRATDTFFLVNLYAFSRIYTRADFVYIYNMIAVLVNCLAVIAGSLVGFLFSKKITSSLSCIVCDGAGIVTLVLGLQMAFAYNSVILVTLAVILGGIIGSCIDIDGKILSLGAFLERKFAKDGTKPSTMQEKNVAGQKLQNRNNFAYAFLNGSVLFCVGTMAIIGSFNAGIHHDYTLIFTKSILDGFMAIVFTASLGIGTAFSAVSIFVYQGLLTMLSIWIAPYISNAMLTEISATGGVLICMIGINLLKLKEIKTANYLPAVLIVALFVLLKELIPFFN